MEDISAKPLATDGASTLWEVSLGLATIQSKGSLVHVRSTAELRQLILLKRRYPLEGIEGAVVDLPIAQRAFNVLKPPPTVGRNLQNTFGGKPIHDAFTEFSLNHISLPNARMEYFYHYRQRADILLRKGYAEIPEVVEYLQEYESRVEAAERETQAKREAIRHGLHHEVFFSEDEARIKKRNVLLGKIMALEHVNFEYGTAACPRIDANDVQQTAAEDINDVCQAISYGLGKKCATYFLYTKNALKERSIMNRYFDYIEKQKTRLHIINFTELDLHDQPDKRARLEFKRFMQRIVEIQDDTPKGQKPQFMLLGAGNQYFIALQAFDFVSSAPTRVDKIIDWSIKRAQGYWFDETYMYPFAPEDGVTIDRAHCPRCAVMRPGDFKDPRYNIWRREHGTHDMNNRSLGFRNAIKSNSLGAYLRQNLAASEFSGFQMMILSP
jgi:hypothetical protein